MKRIISIGLAITLCASLALAGGIVTNTNQSAQFIRTLNRNASTCVDAAYFNPAGLTKLGDGLYISLSNQSVFQTKEMVSTDATFNEDTYEGNVSAPLFPDVHVAYKMGKLAFGGSFMPIGGGGSAEYEKGLPVIESKVSGLPGTMTYLGIPGVTGYSMDATFSGSSVYFGIQAGAAYEINDMISVAAGGRFVSASNSYEGHIKDIMVSTAAAGVQTPGNYARLLATMTSGIDSLTLVGAGMALDAQTADVVVEDATKTGSGFTAIIGVNLTPMEGLNIGIRYEMQTALELETATDVDIEGVLVDGAKEGADMPAMLGLGVAYKVMPSLKAEASFNYYMNTAVDWDGAEDNLDNGFEGGVAFEYKLSDALCASAGFLYAQGGAKDEYQTDLDYSLNSSTVGLGVGYSLSENLGLNVGFANTFYTEGQNAAATETYNKTSIDIAVGVNYSF
ncbi:OmpP1/FadL family transporter [Candidatus Neomarinimicrobiota bacterium]